MIDLEEMEREWDRTGERPDGDDILALFEEIRSLRQQLEDADGLRCMDCMF